MLKYQSYFNDNPLSWSLLFFKIFHYVQSKIILMLCTKCGSHASIPTFYQFSCNTQIKESPLSHPRCFFTQSVTKSFSHHSSKVSKICAFELWAAQDSSGHGRVYRLMHPGTRTGTEPASQDCLFFKAFKQSQSPLLRGGDLGRNKNNLGIHFPRILSFSIQWRSMRYQF